ncbi:MAG: ABC transporter substrate-binding protein [Thermoplasmata archaeon]
MIREKFLIKKVLIFTTVFILVSVSYVTAISIEVGSQNINLLTDTTTNATFSVGWGYTSISDANPFDNGDLANYWIYEYIYDTLCKFNANQTELLPDLAQSWNINLNNHTAIFHLNPAAKWSDGVPVTSQDVNYSYYLAKQDFSFIYPYVAMINSIDTPNNYTVIFHFKGVLFSEATITNVFIVPYHIWKNVDPKNYTVFSSAPHFVGSGPFLLTKYVPNQYIELTRNPNYFIPSRIPHIKTLYIILYSSNNAMVSAFQSGQIDATGGFLLPTQLNYFKNSSATNIVIPKNPIFMYYLALNTNPNGHGNPALRNTYFRQGLAYAINYSQLINMTEGGLALNCQAMFPSWHPAVNPNTIHRPYNVTLANQLLNKSGYLIGSSGYREFPNGTIIKINLLAVVGIPPLVQAAELITGYWKAVGVYATYAPIDAGTMSDIIWPNFDHDGDLWDWPMGLAPYDTASPLFLGLFISSQAPLWDDSGYTNATYDSLFSQMLNATSFSEMRNISYELQESLYYNVPYIVLYYPYSSQVYSKQWTNISTDYPGGPFGGLDWRTFLTIEPLTTTQSVHQNNTLMYIIVIVVVVAAGVGGYAIIRRKNKNESHGKK